MAVRSFRAMILSGVGMAVLGLSVVALAQPQPQSPAGPPTAAPADGSAAQTLDRNMTAMNRAYRTINTNVKDKTKNEATLAAVVQLQTATLAAKAQTPPDAESLSGDAKTKKINEYRVMMAKLLAATAELESNLLAGDNDKAGTTVAAIKAIQDEGHKAFRPQP